MTYDALPTLRFGLSVETPGVYFYRSGRDTGIETQTAPDANGVLQLQTNSLDHSYSEGSVGLYAPLRVRFGGSLDVAKVVLSLEGDVQSKVKDSKLDVDRKFNWNIRAGARWTLNETLRLGAGLFTDRDAERKDAAGGGNIDFYGATIGGQYEKVRWLASDTAGKKEGLTFSSTLALRYAIGVGKLTGPSFDENFDAVDRAVKITVNEITVHLGSGVYF